MHRHTHILLHVSGLVQTSVAMGGSDILKGICCSHRHVSCNLSMGLTMLATKMEALNIYY